MHNTCRNLIAAAVLAASLPAAALAEPCDSYRQTSSNAGNCPNCTVSVSTNGDGVYRIRGSNGWRATATSEDAEGDYLVGDGQWDGQSFSISLNHSGQSAELRMTWDDGSLDVRANLRCR